jgi:hypothetical protein
VIATSRGPLAPLWRMAYRAAARAAAIWLARPGGVAVYLRERAEVVPGLSDLDLLLVTEGEEEIGPAAQRLEELEERLAPIGRPIESVQVDTAEAVARGARDSVLTHGLRDARPSRSIVLQNRPALAGQLRGLRRLAGPDLLPPDPGPWPAALRPGIAWLDLQFWWRQAFLLCAGPSRPWNALSAVKLVAEPLRALSWLEGRPWEGRREHVLRAALERFPAQEEALVHALELARGLAGAPAPDVAVVTGALQAWSTAIAAEMARRAEAAGHAGVRLAGAGPAPAPVPLCDWPARVLPARPDAQLSVARGAPGDPAAVRRAARAWSPGRHPGLRAGDLLALPKLAWIDGRLRSASCPAFDPVTFALLDGEPAARFPELPGLSAADCARRAVAEHSLELGNPAAYPEEDGEGVARLLASARAALFLDSCEAGDPELCVTLAEAAGRIDAGYALEALEAGRGRGEPTDPAVLERLRAEVRAMGPFRH